MEDEIKEEKQSKQDIKKEKIDQAKQEESKVQEEWSDRLKEGQMLEEPEYFEMKHYLEMVIRKKEYGCIIASRAGTGKTYTTLTTMAKKGVQYAYMNSYTTEAGFYIWLYKNRGKICILDDIHKILESDKFTPYLKAALEDQNGVRIVCYNSSKNLQDQDGVYPARFEMTGGIIILTNKLNMSNPHIAAVASRVPVNELEITNSRMLEIMGVMAKSPYKSLTEAERLEVYNFLRKELENSTDLNLRTFKHAMNFYDYAKDISDMTAWKRLITKSLKRDDRDLILLGVLENPIYENDEDRLEAFNKQVADKDKISRATYYREKKRLIGE
jgi:hypothetical protein